MERHSFNGLFTYVNMETESVDKSIYITHVTLSVPFGDLPVGHKCNEVYVNIYDGTIEFVQSWKPKHPERPNDVIPDESYTFNLADFKDVPRNWSGD